MTEPENPTPTPAEPTPAAERTPDAPPRASAGWSARPAGGAWPTSGAATSPVGHTRPLPTVTPQTSGERLTGAPGGSGAGSSAGGPPAPPSTGSRPAGSAYWYAPSTAPAPQQGATPGSPWGSSSTGSSGGPGGPGAPSAPAARPRRRRATASLAALLVAGLVGGVGGSAVYDTWLRDDTVATDAGNTSVVSSLDGTPEAAETSTAPAGSVENVASAVLPSVVSIAVRGPQGQGTGTGVIISSDGQILTNNHVVAAGQDGGAVEVTFSDGTTAPAEVLGTDPLTDLAVIKANGVSELTPAELGSSAELAVGEQVVAIGSPLGLDGTVTTGIVSALQRPVSPGQDGAGQATVIDAVQTDAPINPGNSGGPLVNMQGQVIGINSAIVTGSADSAGSIGLGFAIPIDQAKPIAEELIETGEATHARIGIGVTNATGEIRGALVASVEPGGSAAAAGLQQGDVITKINDRMVTDGTSLIAAARSYRPGDEVTLTYSRDGALDTVDITLGSDATTT